MISPRRQRAKRVKLLARRRAEPPLTDAELVAMEAELDAKLAENVRQTRWAQIAYSQDHYDWEATGGPSGAQIVPDHRPLFDVAPLPAVPLYLVESLGSGTFRARINPVLTGGPWRIT